MTAVVPIESRAGALTRPEPQDLGALTEVEFDRALAKIETRKVRMNRILESYLVPDAHYGKPPGIKKPILYRAGADELMVSFGLEIVTLADQPDIIVAEADFVSVTVRRAICDRVGRILDRTTASCSTKEKRFKKSDGTGFVYQDAREALNDCHAMAEKRAKVRLVVTALGMAAWLSTEEEMEASLEAKEEKPLSPWSDEEKKQVYAAANAKGMGKKAFLALIHETLGRDKVGTGADVEQLLAAIAAWEKPAKPDAEAKAEPESSPPPAPSLDVEYHETAPAPAQASPTAPPAAPSSEAVFGRGNAGPVLPGEIEAAQVEAGELALGDAATRPRRRNAIAEGA